MRVVIGIVVWLFLSNAAGAQGPNAANDSSNGGVTTAPTADHPVAPGFPRVPRNADGTHWLYPTSDRNDYDGVGDALPPVSDTKALSNWFIRSNSTQTSTETDLNFIFIDRATDMVWPAPGKAAVITKDGNAVSVRCKLGERVCYSIYTKDGLASWGLQPGSSCYHCCAICGDGGVNIPITGSGGALARSVPSPQPQSSASSDRSPEPDNNSVSNSNSSLTAPDHDRNPTLLETWYFIYHGHEVTDQNRIEGTKDNGRVVIRGSSRLVTDDQDRIVEEGISSLGFHYRETWTKTGCTIKLVYESTEPSGENNLAIFRFYLDNVLPDAEIRPPYVDREYGEKEPQALILHGAPGPGGPKAIECTATSASQTTSTECVNSYELGVPTYERQVRVQRVLQYIYANYCTGAKYNKPF